MSYYTYIKTVIRSRKRSDFHTRSKRPQGLAKDISENGKLLVQC